jgi:hypothetical protein
VQVLQVLDDDMDDAVAPFQAAADQPGVAVAGDAVKPLPDVFVHDQIDDARFVFQRHKRDAFARARALTHEDHPGNFDLAVVRELCQTFCWDDTEAIERLAVKRHRMRSERQAGGLVIGDHFFLDRSRHQSGRPLRRLVQRVGQRWKADGCLAGTARSKRLDGGGNPAIRKRRRRPGG